MNLALNQARKNLGNTKSNPSVGCVITKDNYVISAGSTSINGRPHAEHNAINLLNKLNINKSTLYVTLEPCSHYGKTKPCVNKIIKKKINKVFYSINDSDFRSNNKSKNILRKKGIYVNQGFMDKKIKSFYRSYSKSKTKPLPFVTCKLAISKDYYTKDNKNQWITNSFSRGRVHLMRSCHDCIITSSETVIKDNPKLNCRIKGLERFTPTRIILDREMKTPKNSKILISESSKKTIIFYNTFNKKKAEHYKNFNIKLYKIPINKDNQLDLKKALIKIKQLGFTRVFLESGLRLVSSFLYNNLIDDFALFKSNKKINRNGRARFLKHFRLFLNNKTKKIEQVNLFGDKLVTYNLK